MLDYDAADDWLDVGFGSQDEPSRAVALNDHITVYTNSTMSRITRLTFGDYGRLLMVNETEFTTLREDDPWVVEDVMLLLLRPPANRLLHVTDPDALIARVLAPTISSLFES
jgi:hypothetical protein